MRSDLSAEETRFLTVGKAIIGTGNVLTELIKFTGMYTELQAYNRTSGISSHNPGTDCFFKHENMGYTTIRKEIANGASPISHRYIKGLSRKWPASFVLISFDAVHIVSESFAYISSKDDLKAEWHLKNTPLLLVLESWCLEQKKSSASKRFNAKSWYILWTKFLLALKIWIIGEER